MRDLLQQLLERPTFEETWPDVYPDAVQKGRQTVLQLEKIRKDKLIMADIVKQNPVLEAWWHDISS
jgi:hypothetical protein